MTKMIPVNLRRELSRNILITRADSLWKSPKTTKIGGITLLIPCQQGKLTPTEARDGAFGDRAGMLLSFRALRSSLLQMANTNPPEKRDKTGKERLC